VNPMDSSKQQGRLDGEQQEETLEMALERLGIEQVKDCGECFKCKCGRLMLEYTSVLEPEVVVYYFKCSHCGYETVDVID